MKKTPREFLKSQQLSQRPARAKGGQPPSARSRIGSVKMRLFVHLLLISCLAADAGSDYAITKSSKIKTNESPSSSVRSLGQRRVLSGYVMDDSTIRTAVAAWLSDATAAEATYGHISTWETSGVTDMANLFSDAYSFNEDIGAWDTSGVTTMYKMFNRNEVFNQDIGAWDTSGVTTMYGMFYNCYAFFNQDIGAWDTSSVRSMKWMFDSAMVFNQDLSGWAVHSVTDMQYMFRYASAFDQDLGWCVDDDVNLNDAFGPRLQIIPVLIILLQ